MLTLSLTESFALTKKVTGASQRRQGRFELAKGGTIVLACYAFRRSVNLSESKEPGKPSLVNGEILNISKHRFKTVAET